MKLPQTRRSLRIDQRLCSKCELMVQTAATCAAPVMDFILTSDARHINLRGVQEVEAASADAEDEFDPLDQIHPLNPYRVRADLPDVLVNTQTSW